MKALAGRKQRAVIVGGTGAIGKSLVAQILALGLYESVTYIGRRGIEYDGATQVAVVSVPWLDNVPYGRCLTTTIAAPSSNQPGRCGKAEGGYEKPRVRCIAATL